MKVLDLWPSRESKYLIEHFSKIDGRENVRGIAMDMSKDYRRVCEKMFPNARIVCDRFHVMKLISGALIDIKENVLDSYMLANNSDPKKKKEIKEDFTVLRDLMLLNQEDLNDKSKQKLGQLLIKYPEMSVPYLLKEDFRDIYRCSDTKAEAVKRYDDWTKGYDHKDPLYAPYEKLRKVTFKNWRFEFFNYFEFKEEGISITNGPTEGLNNVVKSIMRTGRGYPKFEVLRAKCVLGANMRDNRIITAKMQSIKKKMMRQGITDETLYEADALRLAASEAETERRKRRRDMRNKRNSTSKQKRKILGDDKPDGPPDESNQIPVQGKFDFD